MAKTAKEKLFESIDGTFANMRNNLQSYSYINDDTLKSVFWTEEQRRGIGDVSRYIGNHMERSSQIVPHEFTVPENMPCLDMWEGRKVTFQLRLTQREFAPYPNLSMGVSEGAPVDAVDDLRSAYDEACRLALDAAYFNYVRKYALACEDIALMRYLFPGFLVVLRNSGHDQLASKHETIKRAQAVNLNPFTRDVFKYVNQWFAMQVLLDTFKGNKPTPPNSYSKVQVTSVSFKIDGVPSFFSV